MKFGKRACRTAPRLMPKVVSWCLDALYSNLATGFRGFSPLVFSGEFHTPRLPEALQAVHRNAHPRPLGIHFHILWYRPKYTFLSQWVCMRADPDGKLGEFTQLPAKVGRDFSLVQS